MVAVRSSHAAVTLIVHNPSGASTGHAKMSNAVLIPGARRIKSASVINAKASLNAKTRSIAHPIMSVPMGSACLCQTVDRVAPVRTVKFAKMDGVLRTPNADQVDPVQMDNYAVLVNAKWRRNVEPTAIVHLCRVVSMPIAFLLVDAYGMESVRPGRYATRSIKNV